MLTAKAGTISTTVKVLVVSADGIVMVPQSAAIAAFSKNSASEGITTAEGAWNFGTPPDASGDYPVLLNGSGAGWADLLEVTNGRLYAKQKSGQWWAGWSAA